MNNIIEIIATKIEENEHTQSSHWKKYHSNFEYSKGKLNGLEGFGTHNTPLKGFKKIIYNTLFISTQGIFILNSFLKNKI